MQAKVRGLHLAKGRRSWCERAVRMNERSFHQTVLLTDHAHIKTEYLNLVGIGLGDRVGKVEGQWSGTKHW